MALDHKHEFQHEIYMNKLPLAKRVQIMSMLCEGSSMRSISRAVNVSINTVSKLLEKAGRACAVFHDNTARGVQAKRVQVDGICSFWYSKHTNVSDAKKLPGCASDVLTLTAIEADTKLIISYLISGRMPSTRTHSSAI